METLDVEQILEQDAYLGALTTAGAYSLLHPQLERCLTGTGGIALPGAPDIPSENLQHAGQKKNYSVFFLLKDTPWQY